MKKFVVIISIFLSAIIINISYSQTKEKEKEKDSKAVKDESREKDKKVSGSIPDGYGAIKWGSLLSDVKKGITGKLSYSDDRQVIISKDGDLEYRYGFFHESTKPEGKFLYLSMTFPYLSLDDVKNKLESKFGKATSEVITNNQGAMAWDSEKTLIILWVDRYENKPYSRRITYLGKEIARELNDAQKKVFNKTEIEIINKLNP